MNQPRRPALYMLVDGIPGQTTSLELPSSCVSSMEETANSPFTPQFATHKAANEGDVHKLQTLFTSISENPFEMNDQGMTPLHIAVNYGNPRISLAMTEVIVNCKYIEKQADSNKSMRTLIDAKETKNGETALHLSAKNVHRKTVEFLLRNGADVNIKSKENKEAIEFVYRFVPQAMMDIFHSSVNNNGPELHEEKFKVDFNFGPIVGVPGPDDPYVFKETRLLKNALKGSPSKYEDLLLHPLVQAFLYYKWEKIQILLGASIILHIIWLWVYSYFVGDLCISKCPYSLTINTSSVNEALNETSPQTTGTIYCRVERIHIVLAWILIVSSACMALKEVYEFRTALIWQNYIFHLENILQIFVIFTTTIAAVTILVFGTTTANSNASQLTSFPAWYYQIASCGVFFAWTLILLQVGKVLMFGIYVQVLVKVVRRFSLFITAFSSLLIGFAISFSILMPQNDKFSSVPFGLSKILVMMTGELQYDEIFYNEDTDGKILFPIPAQICFTAFVVMVTIILFNLLIGFTVSDIQGLLEKALTIKLCKQIEQIYVMESFIFSPGFISFVGLFSGNPETLLMKFMVTGFIESADVSPRSPQAHTPSTNTLSATFTSGASNSPNAEANSEESSLITDYASLVTFGPSSDIPTDGRIMADSTVNDTFSGKFSTVVTKTKKQIPKDIRSKVVDLAIRNLEGSTILDEAPGVLNE